MIRQLRHANKKLPKRLITRQSSHNAPQKRLFVSLPPSHQSSSSSSSGKLNTVNFSQNRFLSSVQHEYPVSDISEESSSSMGTVSRRDVLLNSFARETTNNVNHILQFLDQKHTKRGRKINLSKRWQKSIRIEKQRHDRRHGGSEKQQLSVDEQWAEALEASNIPFREPSATESTSKVLSESDHMTMEIDEILVDEADATDFDTMSPILGLGLDETGRLAEFDNLPTTDEETGAPVLDVEAYLNERRYTMLNRGGNIHIDATLRAVALLSASNMDEWDIFDNRHKIEEEKEDESITTNDVDHDKSEPLANNGIRDLLRDMESAKYTLTTAESNLLLSQLVTSTDASVDDILNGSLNLFEQMKTLAYTGREESGPDAITYRILLMALSRRLMATGEALKLAQELFVSGVELTPEAFLNCMQICYARNDIGAATNMLNNALENDESFRPPVDSYIRMIDMMKSRNLQEDALKLLKRAQELNSLNIRDEGKLLSSLCNWPLRSRRGDLIDTAPLLVKILAALENRSRGDEKPEQHIWTTLIGRLARQAKTYGSHWKDVNRALRTFLSLYPGVVPNPTLLKLCLDAGEAVGDASIVDLVIQNEVERQSKVQTLPLEEMSFRSEEISWDQVSDSQEVESNTETKKEGIQSQVASIPQGVFRRGLQICLRNGDAKSATSILSSFDSMIEVYPKKVQSEIFGLTLLCHTTAGRAEDAKNALLQMAEQNMEPSEALHGAVLYSLVVNGRNLEAFELFDKMGQKESELTMEPGISCFNAIFLAHVRSQSWAKAISLHQTMQRKTIPESPQTVQSLILANYKTGGKSSVVSLLEKLLAGDASVDERTFLLAARVLLRDASGSTADIRKMLRVLGESNESLKRPSLNLTRSLRTAQVEQHRRVSKSDASRVKSQQEVGAQAWHSAIVNLLTMVQALSSSNTS